ncbi:thiamine pyrophosphate-binding protein [Actinomadura sp. 21ATH]|uniref:thiamine pyrophosphate-binding protein n=1 Tax=Actinomadura sp. 21ATH TaxID=1735444 RepID=UPI0035BFE68E
MDLNGGTLLARTLAETASIVFTLHGGHLDSFYKGCADEGIELLDFRHEAAAVNAADGYARVTGGLGVAAVTSGPGFANGFAGITHAYADDVPLLVIVAAPPLREVETRELQGGIDQIAALKPVTKWAHRITTPERIPDLVGLAVRRALSGRPGPVALELPIDVAFTPVNPAHVRPAGAPRIGARPAPGRRALAAALETLESAERPVVLVGEGARWARDDAALAEFAEATGLPVLYGGPASRGLPPRHPLNGHGAGSLVALAMSGGGSPDVVLLLGFTPGLSSGGRPGAVIPADAKIVQVDADAAEIGRLGPVHVAVQADPVETMAALLAAHEGRPWRDRREWAEKVVNAHRLMDLMYADAPDEVGGRLHPYHATRNALAALDPGAVVIADGGETAGWVGSAITATEPALLLNHGHQGHLGIGHGMAIGAQRAEPGRRVVQITGDGAVGFHIQEFDTMVRHALPIVTVVLSNDTWGMSVHGQDAVLGAGNDLISRLAPTPYEKVAQAFGAHGEHVTEMGEVGPAVRRALDSGRPALVNLAVSNEVVHPMTTAMLGDVHATDEIVIPYYENIPLK